VIRWLAILACALTVCITASSAFIRHSQAGLGCPGWPTSQCALDAAKRSGGDAARAGERAGERAGAPVAAQALPQPQAQGAAVRVARALHRVSAMLVGVLVLLIAVFGWSSMHAGGRVALAVALVDTFFLAWLGRFTPHPIPLVTIANLVGGIALAAALAWIAASMPSRYRAGAPAGAVALAGTRSGTGVGTVARLPAFLALALLAAAAWIGTMIGAHDAIGACEGTRCLGALRLDLRALDPLRAAQPIDAAVANGLHWLHRLVAAAFAVAALVVIARARRHGVARGALLLVVLLAAQVATGVGTTNGAPPLATATLHNAFATLLAVALAAIAARSRPQRGARG